VKRPALLVLRNAKKSTGQTNLPCHERERQFLFGVRVVAVYEASRVPDGTWDSQVPVQVPFFPLLIRILAFPQVFVGFAKALETRPKAATQHPPLAIPMHFAKPANVINDAQPAHLGSDCFQCPWADAMLPCYRLKRRHKLAGRPLDLHKNRQKRTLVHPVAREERSGKVIELCNSRDSTVVQIHFRTWRSSHPGLFA
jgi:hypothetical protein